MNHKCVLQISNHCSSLNLGSIPHFITAYKTQSHNLQVNAKYQTFFDSVKSTKSGKNVQMTHLDQ